jgi:hypothetical protein
MEQLAASSLRLAADASGSHVQHMAGGVGSRESLLGGLQTPLGCIGMDFASYSDVRGHRHFTCYRFQFAPSLRISH